MVFGDTAQDRSLMPLSMDRHDLQAATGEDVAAAHIRDLEIQQRHGSAT
jgi:hypothetical protein